MNRELLKVDISDLKVSKFNDSIYGDEPVDTELADSLEKYGQITPLLVQHDNVILSGSRRFKAMKHLGWDQADCEVLLDISPEECKLLTIEANRTRTKTPEQISAEVWAIIDLHDTDMARSKAQLQRRKEDKRVSVTPLSLVDKVAQSQGVSKSTAKRRIAKAKGKPRSPQSPQNKLNTAYRAICRAANELDNDDLIQDLKSIGTKYDLG